METLGEAVFSNLRTAKQLSDNGFLTAFLGQCGSQSVDDEDFNDIAWSGIISVFPGICVYYNAEIEVDTMVLFDPLIDEFCRLCTLYEMKHSITPGESRLRTQAESRIYDSFDMPYYEYDYSFRICSMGHGRKRFVLLTGMEFCGFYQLPCVLCGVRCALESQVAMLRKEMEPQDADAAEAMEKEAA